MELQDVIRYVTVVRTNMAIPLTFSDSATRLLYAAYLSFVGGFEHFLGELIAINSKFRDTIEQFS